MPGKSAVAALLLAGVVLDLLLVDGDPLADIAAVDRIRDVFLDGARLVRRSRATD